jgi:hypothetical protein
VLVALVYYVIYIRTPRVAPMPAAERRETLVRGAGESGAGGNPSRPPAARE